VQQTDPKGVRGKLERSRDLVKLYELKSKNSFSSDTCFGKRTIVAAESSEIRATTKPKERRKEERILSSGGDVKQTENEKG